MFSKARDDPELGPPLAKLRASLSPLGLWNDDEDCLRVLLIVEAFVRVREGEQRKRQKKRERRGGASGGLCQ